MSVSEGRNPIQVHKKGPVKVNREGELVEKEVEYRQTNQMV